MTSGQDRAHQGREYRAYLAEQEYARRLANTQRTKIALLVLAWIAMLILLVIYRQQLIDVAAPFFGQLGLDG